MERLEWMIIALLLLQSITLLLFLFRIKDKRENRFENLLKEYTKEQRETVAKQLAEAATEQFKVFTLMQESLNKSLLTVREELTNQLLATGQQLDNRLFEEQKANRESGELWRRSIADNLSQDRESLKINLKDMNNTLEQKIASLQESNEKRLQEMQNVVDEKLQATLETRLAQSFSLVSQQLESVQKGLGEMKSLAADTKSLKNALINVKDRGTYGEVRLEKLLSDILAPGQYDTNVEIKPNRRVEFAVRLPGQNEEPLYLPIDSKFPIEDYNRILDSEDKQTIEENRKALALKLRAFAKDINEKYIDPPKTTDFALLFLPTEGLYAEVVQNAALFEELRNKYKVIAVGATTLSAFLSSLQMGFKTLAIEQRSQEVWNTLRAVKNEFQKFGEILLRAQKQIQTADKTLEEIVGRRTKAINRTLRQMEELPEADLAAYKRGDLLVGLQAAEYIEDFEEEQEEPF